MKRNIAIWTLVLIFLPFFMTAKNLTEIKTLAKQDEKKLSICNIKVECLENDMIQLTLSAYLPSPSGKAENLIRIIDNKNINLIVDSSNIVNPVSKNCADEKRKDKISLGLVIDNSGSMSESISEYDRKKRMDASKYTINQFINILNDEDRVFVESFSNQVVIPLDFTTDKNEIKLAVHRLLPQYATQMHGAVLTGLNKINTSSDKIKALIILTDGLNNISPLWGPVFVHRLVDLLKGTKLFFVALSMGNSPDELDAKENMKIMASLSAGSFFDVYNSDKLDSVYKSLRNEIKSDECCDLVFKFPAKSLFSKRQLKLLVNNSNTTYTTTSQFTDICKDFYPFSIDSACIRVRFAIAGNNDDFFKYKTELMANEIELFKIESPYPIMDVISYRSFGSAMEAEMYIEEFNEKQRIFPDKYKLKYSPEIYYCTDNEIQW